ncbi:pentapeptide repeat-containing protein [Bacteroides sp.]|uniref:pentapeptide repeat-containing protein n=1 Tax=Bacteroides sp. TaxID=29523 RepID=UPI0026272E56|nr:pentapeptide repeat-containing protein [Bacteroides sp.]MDD3037348.1 pentapeptide repeat-containing protein [Bacteroides sp.]
MIKKNCSKSVRVVPPMLEEQRPCTYTLQELLNKEETISDFLFSRGKEEDINVSHKSFKNCTFQYQSFIECQFNSSQLTDVRFENCDLSNISFAESSLYRVEFISCKLLGTNLSGTTLNHVLLHDCNAGYINLAMSKMNQVRFTNSLFRSGIFHDCRLSCIAFESCDLVEADFSHTSLRGIDLRTSRISGLTINISDLKGAIITSLQAMDLLPLLGVIIED